jgi:serine/threonine-protein kinase
VSIYAFGEQDGIPFLVMQFLAGGTLADRIRSEPLPDQAVAPLLADLADALSYAHRQGVVHRDIKPENVLLGDPGSIAHPMIADFGVATRPLQDTGPGERRLGYGTPHFMSPEQARGDLDLDGRSDLFSLGVLGYLLLTGSYPYDGPSEPAIAAAKARGARTPLHLAAPDAPPPLVAAIERCLAPDPANRWQSAGQFADAVRRTVGGSLQSGSWSPVTTLAALVGLALGLGAVTSLFIAP